MLWHTAPDVLRWTGFGHTAAVLGGPSEPEGGLGGLAGTVRRSRSLYLECSVVGVFIRRPGRTG